MYDMDVLKAGEIGGHCTMDSSALQSEVGRLSALQTWLPELRNFEEIQQSPMEHPSTQCDQLIETPVYIVKIDASTHMFHDHIRIKFMLFFIQLFALYFIKMLQFLLLSFSCEHVPSFL